MALLPLLNWIENEVSSFDFDGLYYFFRGSLFGFIYMGAFHFWFFQLTPWSSTLSIGVLWFFYTLVLSLFYGAVVTIYAYFRDDFYHMLLLPALWTGMEWLKAWGPFGNPAGSLGYTQTGFPPFLQLASYGGVYGLTFLVVLINVMVFHLYRRGTIFSYVNGQSPRTFNPVLFAVIVLTLCWGAGRYVLKQKQSFQPQTLKTVEIGRAHV